MNCDFSPEDRRARSPPPRSLLSVPGLVLLAQAPTPYDSTVLAAVKWREIGIFRGGRSVAVAGSTARPAEYWMARRACGRLQTTDGGNTWLPATESTSRYDRRDRGERVEPRVVYVGTASTPSRGNVSRGDGMFKTTDGGRTWTFVGLAETQQICASAFHPDEPRHRLRAAPGKCVRPNPERGIYKTTDGGKTWTKILSRQRFHRASDLAMDPRIPSALTPLFAAQRFPWKLVSGAQGAGFSRRPTAGPTDRAVAPTPPCRAGCSAISGWRCLRRSHRRVGADRGGFGWRVPLRRWRGHVAWINHDHKLRVARLVLHEATADPKDPTACTRRT